MSDGLRRLDARLAAGRLDEVRAALLALSGEERELLEQELGAETLRRIYATARRRARGKLGRVVLLNGIMGASLDVIKGGDRDGVWINYWRLLQGRIGDLRLRADGVTPAKAGVRVEVAGLYRKTYLALALELDSRWDCLQFPFDWRHDIRASAGRLAEAVRSWAGGEPVHLVAHSMGGLVARAFVRQFPDAWAGMADPAGRAGGRLVMLGTPNRGSFAIPLMMTGEEKLVRQLARLDLAHSRKELLQIIGTFPGGMQMLPSPLVELNDDHARLFAPKEWGRFPVSKAFLADAARFHDELHPVLTPERLVYVAGYDQETPDRIRIEGPGKFSYRTTRAGDGRVPHALGLLDGVPTRWVREVHGDLPRNEDVLEAVHELLLTGETSLLEATPPPVRRGPADERWRAPEEFEIDPDDLAELEALVKRVGSTRSRKAPPAATAEGARLAALLGEEFLGSVPRGPRAPRARPAKRAGGKPDAPPELRVEVVWGDVTRAEGDVYCVGHYSGVLPQRAEWALDLVVSFDRRTRGRIARGAAVDPRRLVLRGLTRRGVLRGALGEVTLLPWADERDRHRSVAVAGMGHPGAFTAEGLRRLAESLAWTVGALPACETICTVLIGSGEGCLSVEESTAGLVGGLADAVRAGLRGSVRLLRIVERDHAKAHRIAGVLRALARRERDLRLRVASRSGSGGRIEDEQALAYVLAAAASAAGSRAAGSRDALAALWRRIPSAAGRRRRARESLASLADAKLPLEKLALRLTVSTEEPDAVAGSRAVPARISFVRRGRGIRVAAIDDTAVVPERDLGIDFALIEELSERTTDPAVDDLPVLAAALRRRLVPADLREHVSAPSAKVLEVDRDTAIVHWELLALDDAAAGERWLGLEQPVARQLRTAYSGRPAPALREPGPLRALVVGDPGDPRQGDDLPGAREEAERVVRLLRARGVETHYRIGAPRGRRARWGRQGGPATRLEILSLLDGGAYDLLHYSGHGDFDPEDPTRTGWVFHDGLLTAGDLETVARVPRLVVANACLSGRASRALRGGARVEVGASDAGLLPSLADEFLRRGARNYVGTAWEVSDEGAVLFAEELYGRLLPDARSAPGAGGALGDALLAARKRLAGQAELYGALWLAYQHYGDPDFRL